MTRTPALDVIVVGAGLSGLRAAVELHEAGYSVLVLEARDRVRPLQGRAGQQDEGGVEFGCLLPLTLGLEDLSEIWRQGQATLFKCFGVVRAIRMAAMGCLHVEHWHL